MTLGTKARHVGGVAVGSGVRVGRRVRVGVSVAVGDGPTVGVMVVVGVAVIVGVWVGVVVGVALGVGLAVGVALGVGVSLGVAEAVAVAVAVGVAASQALRKLAAGVADWPTLFSMLRQGGAIGGGVIFAMITAWVFGREFSDHTVKELLALPTPREAIVGAKFLLLILWILLLTLWIVGLELVIGWLVEIPGWSVALAQNTFAALLVIAILNFMLMPFVALIASLGRGYLPPLGWTFLTVALAQISVVLGWGEWFPWAVPALYSGMAGPDAGLPGIGSFVVIAAAFLSGTTATFIWWRQADQAS